MVRALRIYKEVVYRRSQAQAVEPAKRVDDGEDDDRAEVRGGVVLVEARRDLADVEPAHLARAQHVLDERQHDLGVKAERLRCADARGKRGGKHVRADGDVCVVALVEVLVEAFKNRLKI